MTSATPDFYELLGLPRGASQEEIEAAYRRLERELQGAHSEDPEISRRRDEVTRAYETLRQPDKRALYDELIGAPSAPPTLPAGTGVAAVPWTLGDIVRGLVFWVLLLAGVGLFFGMAMAFVIALRGRTDTGPVDLLMFAAMQLGELVMFLAAWRFGIFKYKAPWSRLGFRAPEVGSSPVMWMVITVIGMFAVSAIYGFIAQSTHIGPFEPGPTIPPQLFNTQFDLVIFAFLAVIVAPIAEETFFRGFIFAGLSRRWGFVWGALASAAIFSVAHISLAAIIPIFCLGLLLAALYTKTKSIWFCMIAHGIYNGLAVLAFVANLPY